MNEEEELKKQTQLNRDRYNNQIIKFEQLPINTQQYLGYDAALGMAQISDSEGNIFYAYPDTNGAVAIGDPVRGRGGGNIPHYDQMPALEQKSSNPTTKTIETINMALLYTKDVERDEYTAPILGSDWYFDRGRCRPVLNGNSVPEGQESYENLQACENDNSIFVAQLSYVNNVTTMISLFNLSFNRRYRRLDILGKVIIGYDFFVYSYDVLTNRAFLIEPRIKVYSSVKSKMKITGDLGYIDSLIAPQVAVYVNKNLFLRALDISSTFIPNQNPYGGYTTYKIKKDRPSFYSEGTSFTFDLDLPKADDVPASNGQSNPGENHIQIVILVNVLRQNITYHEYFMNYQMDISGGIDIIWNPPTETIPCKEVWLGSQVGNVEPVNLKLFEVVDQVDEETGLSQFKYYLSNFKNQIFVNWFLNLKEEKFQFFRRVLIENGEIANNLLLEYPELISESIDDSLDWQSPIYSYSLEAHTIANIRAVLADLGLCFNEDFKISGWNFYKEYLYHLDLNQQPIADAPTTLIYNKPTLAQDSCILGTEKNKAINLNNLEEGKLIAASILITKTVKKNG